MATRAKALAGLPGVEDDYGLPGEPSWMEIDWREHLHSAEIDGSTVNYVELGEGPPIVFVHGLGGCWQNWLENLPYFAQHHRVIAVDLPGFGRSELPRGEISIPNYGRFIDSLLRRLGVERATLVGNSMGGFVSTEVAISFPTWVEKLVLVSAAGAHELPGKVNSRQALRAASISQPLTDAVIKRAEFLARRPRGRRLMLGMVCRYPERLSAAMTMEMIAGAGKPAFDDALHSIFSYDFRDRLGEVSAPALIIWGRNDMVVPVRCADIYERALPDSRKLIMESTGHVAMIERAHTFNRTVAEFVRS